MNFRLVGLAPYVSWQDGHSGAAFSSSSGPPSASGTMWWTSTPSVRHRQQWKCAARFTVSLVVSENAIQKSLDILGKPCVRPIQIAACAALQRTRCVESSSRVTYRPIRPYPLVAWNKIFASRYRGLQSGVPLPTFSTSTTRSQPSRSQGGVADDDFAPPRKPTATPSQPVHTAPAASVPISDHDHSGTIFDRIAGQGGAPSQSDHVLAPSPEHAPDHRNQQTLETPSVGFQQASRPEVHLNPETTAVASSDPARRREEPTPVTCSTHGPHAAEARSGGGGHEVTEHSPPGRCGTPAGRRLQWQKPQATVVPAGHHSSPFCRHGGCEN